MKKRYIVLGIFIAILAAGAVFWQFNVSEAAKNAAAKEDKNARLEKLLDRDVKVEKQSSGEVKYDGKYFSLVYPGEMRVKKDEKTEEAVEGGTLERLYLLMSEPRINLVVVVTDGSGINKIEDFPSVKLRRTQNDIYLFEEITVPQRSKDNTEGQNLDTNSVKAVVFSKDKEGTEKTAFFVSNGKIYSFSVSGFNKEEVYSFFEKVIQSLEIKK